MSFLSKVVFIFSSLFFILGPPAFPVETSPQVPESVYKTFQKNAENAVASSNKKEADFWMARYLGFSAASAGSGHSLKDLEALIKNRKFAPKAFVSGEWDEDFIDWFEKSLYVRWGVDDKKVRAKQRSFEITESRYRNKYYATIVAWPQIELWHVVKNGLVTRPLLLLMGSASERPMLFFGKILKGTASLEFTPMILDTKKRSLHYVWKPEFYDLDGDGASEVWVRFNIAWGNGFVQILEIYRIQNDSELVLLKRFQSGDDGFARRLPDGGVELGSAFDSRKTGSRLDYDSHHIETWYYKESDFKKTSENNIPFILKSAGWKDYFLEN